MRVRLQIQELRPQGRDFGRREAGAEEAVEAARGQGRCRCCRRRCGRRSSFPGSLLGGWCGRARGLRGGEGGFGLGGEFGRRQGVADRAVDVDALGCG